VAEPVDTPSVVFIGAPGSGKSRIGKRVARLLELPFVDTDKRIVAAHGPITEIFTTFGEQYFRDVEREQVSRALKEPGVISLGGGAVLDPRTQDDLEPLLVVQLSVSEEALAGRNPGVKRPLLPDGIESWRALMAVRTPIYNRLADHTWDTSALPAERIADDIASWLKEAIHD
jgi:shikimate kinase